MILIPKEKPVIENLNSYYLDIGKLFEHYQGELGAGGMYFRSPSAEGVVFFDKDELLSGAFRNKEGESQGKTAIDRIMETAQRDNFTISIYEIDYEKVFFWANIPFAKEIYKDLSTEFTDLQGLMKKMSSEKLTGYISVSIHNGEEEGIIFFNNGEIVGGSYSWGEGEFNNTEKDLQALTQKTKDLGGTFTVSRIVPAEGKGKRKGAAAPGKGPLPDVYRMLEGLLGICERVIQSDKKIRTDFNTLLKNQFLKKVEEFPFLDPFEGEFEYSEGEVKYRGDADEEEVAKGVILCVKEMAEELEMTSRLKNELEPWSEKYAKELAAIGVGF